MTGSMPEVLLIYSKAITHRSKVRFGPNGSRHLAHTKHL